MGLDDNADFTVVMPRMLKRSVQEGLAFGASQRAAHEYARRPALLCCARVSRLASLNHLILD